MGKEIAMQDLITLIISNLKSQILNFKFKKNEQPYPLHPMPYTLPSTPFALPPAFCTLHPTPYSLHPTPSARRAGFTLLELTISITILGIIVLIISSAMSVSFRSMNSGEKKMESLERMRASLKIIDSQIQSAMPLTHEDKDDIKYYFAGHNESLRLSTNYSLWSDNRGYVVVTYKVVSDNLGKKTLYAYENIIGLENIREAKLLEDFDEINFEYYYKGPTGDDAEGTWISEWKTFYIPEKIRLHLADGTKRFSIIIPMRAKESLL